MPSRRATALLIFALPWACTTTPTQLVVYVDTDMTVPTEMDGFRIRVLDGEEKIVREEWFEVGDGDGAISLPASFGIAPRGRDPGRDVRVEVEATRGENRTVLFGTAAETGFVEGEQLRLDLYLARRCKDLTCSARQACRPAGCEPVAVDPGALPDDGDTPAGSPACVPRGVLSSTDVYRSVGGLAVAGSTLFVADVGFRSIAITDPSAPGPPQGLSFGGANTNDVVLSGTTALVYDVSGLFLLDTDTLVWNPPGAGSFRLGVGGVASAGEHLAVATYAANALVTFDPADPDAPLGQTTVEILGLDVAADGPLAFTTWGQSVTVVDITEPTDPLPVGYLGLGVVCTRLAAAGSLAFVACGPEGLHIVSAADPSAPERLARTVEPAADVAVRGAYAFVAALDDGLVVLDVRDPTAPAFVASFPVGGVAGAVAIAGDVAYLGTNEVLVGDVQEEPGRVHGIDVACFPAR